MTDQMQGDLLAGVEDGLERVAFAPARAAGLARLDRFAPRAGRAYAGQRNYDFGPERRSNVSALSPWIRHRMVSEEEVLRATLARHSPAGAEKFIQEVFWRAYFKGWLEQRPTVWASYQGGLALALDEAGDDYAAALEGRTGIACFDTWAQELVATGYLHNHARMWFASIWIFTLRLPWELGADFFLRHLIDGDPASNTLSWRWVAGLHTKGKTYLARPDNIAKYTSSRFEGTGGLAREAIALEEDEVHDLSPLRLPDPLPDAPFVWAVTEDDCTLDLTLPRPPVAAVGLLAQEGRSTKPLGALARNFAHAGVAEGAHRISPDAAVAAQGWAEAIVKAAEQAGVADVVIAYAPVGPTSDALRRAERDIARAGLRLHQVRRGYDALAWPHATRGFFALKKKIPALLSGLGLSA